MTNRHRPTLLSRRRRDPLTRELAQFRSQADLTELGALLDRHPDADTERLRDLVDWTPAA